MSRILAIDYGRRRCGIAVTDPNRIVATALATVETARLVGWLKNYLASEEVGLVIVGEPTTMQGTPSESMRYIRPALARLRREFPTLEFVMWDERFTSTLAHRAMLDAGYRRKDRQDKGAIDRMAAVIILNSYLESRAAGLNFSL